MSTAGVQVLIICCRVKVSLIWLQWLKLLSSWWALMEAVIAIVVSMYR